MTKIAVLAETEHEARVALSPETAKKFIGFGCDIHVLAGAGSRSRISDAQYQEMGAKVSHDLKTILNNADIILKVGPPSLNEIPLMKSGALLVTILDPFGDRGILETLAKAGISSFAMEFMPRITRAQSMDVLSSQSNLAGYKAVIDAAAMLDHAIPMMMTAAGTVPPAKIFVMGAGVAGLQAIATARRLGAIVTATDVRPASKEQVQSLGAKFIAVEDDEFKQAETSGGYAKEMSDAYKQKQAELVASHVKNQDVVITTALIPGRPAPKLISKAMVETMHPGAVIVDLAAERGGNCELTRPGEIYEHSNGVKILGRVNLAGELAKNASSLYARNVFSFVETMLDKKTGALSVKWDDEIITATLITKDGQIVHPRLVMEKV